MDGHGQPDGSTVGEAALSNDLLLKIIKHVPLSTRLETVELISKRWCAPSRSEDLWHKVKLDDDLKVTKELLQKLIKASTLYCGAKVAPWRTYSSPIRTLDLRGAYDELLVIDLLDATVPNMPQLVELRVNDGEYLHFAYAELKHATARVSCASAVNDHRFCSMNPLMPVPASAIDLLACCGTLRLLQVLDRLELDASDTVTRVVERVPLTELRVVSVGGCVSRGVLIGHRDYWQEGRGVCVCVEGCVGWAQGLLAGGLRCVCMCRGVCWLDV